MTVAVGESSAAPAAAPTAAVVNEDGFATDTHGQLLVPDTDSEDDRDSTLGSDDDSFYTSLSSSVTDYVYENGRRYHAYKAGQYNLPNDSLEIEREEMKHHALALVMGGKTHLAPIGDNPQLIIDIGTGCGSWAVAAADEYPGAEVIGTDLSPVQPRWVPPNLHFDVDDAEMEWVYKPDSIDLVHLRWMYTGIKDWTRLFEQAQRCIKPGGWIEIVEYELEPHSDDDTIPESAKILEYLRNMKVAASKAGLDLGITHRIPDLVKEAGFVNVTRKLVPTPMGTWAKEKVMKEAGALFRVQTILGLSGIAMALFTRFLGWTSAEVELLVMEVRKELNGKAMHAYWNNHVIYAQKPLDYEQAETASKTTAL